VVASRTEVLPGDEQDVRQPSTARGESDPRAMTLDKKVQRKNSQLASSGTEVNILWAITASSM